MMGITKTELIVMLTGVCTVIVLLSIWISVKDRKDKKKGEALFVGKVGSERILKLYSFLRNNMILGTYTKKLSRQFEAFYPTLEQQVAKSTVLTMVGIIGMDVILFNLLFLIRPQLLTFFIVLFLGYVIQTEVINISMNLANQRLLNGLDGSITDIRHYFNQNHNVYDALWTAIGNCDKRIRVHLEEIYRILSLPDAELAVKEYNERNRSKYFKRLLGICYQTVERGNVKNPEGQSVFEENIFLLKKDIFRELEQIKKISFLFSGLAFVCTFPIVSLPFIQAWAIDLMTDFEAFYYGSKGFYIVVLSFGITILSYHFLNQLKGYEDVYRKQYRVLTRFSLYGITGRILQSWQERHYGTFLKRKRLLKQLGEKYNPGVLLLRQFLFGICGFFLGMVILFSAHMVQRRYLLTDVNEIHSLLPTKRTQKIMEPEEIQKLVQMLWEEEAGAERTALVLQENGITKEKSVSDITMIIQDKFEKIKKEYVKWYEILGNFGFTILCYFTPLLFLQLKKQYLEDFMQQEVIQFKSILSTQIYLKGITTYEMLESMEAYSIIFKASLQNCLNGLQKGEEKALKELKEEESFLEFQRLIECFILSDSIGITKAFDEVISDIRYFQEDQELELEMKLKHREDIAWIVAVIPFGFILSAYLMIPFITFGMNMYSNSYVENMNELSAQ